MKHVTITNEIENRTDATATLILYSILIKVNVNTIVKINEETLPLLLFKAQKRENLTRKMVHDILMFGALYTSLYLHDYVV